MSSPLTIWLPEKSGASWAWMHADGRQGWAVTREERSELTRLGSGLVNLILPGQWVRLFSHSLPKMRTSERLTAAGFSIEDDLAGPISAQHVILGKGDDNRIGVIATAKMNAILKDVSEAGLTPQKIHVDFDVITGEDDIELMDRIISPGPTGYALDHGQSTKRHPSVFKNRFDMSNALNFAQGSFSAKTSAFGGNLGHIWRIAALFVMTGLVWLVWQGSQAAAIKAQAAEIRAQTSELYTQATGKPAPANIASVVRRASATGQTGGNFLLMAQNLTSGLADVDDVVIETMRYDSRKNELALRLIYPNFETAGEIESLFKSRGQSFTSGAVREQGDTLIGEAVFTLDGKS